MPSEKEIKNGRFGFTFQTLFVVVVVVVFVVYFGLFVRAEVKINTDRERSNEHLVTLYSLPLSLSHSLTLSYTSSLSLSLTLPLSYSLTNPVFSFSLSLTPKCYPTSH